MMIKQLALITCLGLSSAAMAQETKGKPLKVENTTEEISEDKLLAELSSDNPKTRRDAFKKAQVLPKEKILALHK